MGSDSRGFKKQKEELNIICWLKSNHISVRFQSRELLVFNEGIIRSKVLREAEEMILLSFRNFWAIY